MIWLPLFMSPVFPVLLLCVYLLSNGVVGLCSLSVEKNSGRYCIATTFRSCHRQSSASCHNQRSIYCLYTHSREPGDLENGCPGEKSRLCYGHSDSKPYSASVAQLKSFSTYMKFASTAALGATVFSMPRPARAIGNLYELQKGSMVLQDITFNVPDVTADVDMMRALFQQRFRGIRSSTSASATSIATAGAVQSSVVAFGADAYEVPPRFRPGVSDLQEYGGHATITLRSSRGPGTVTSSGTDETETEIFDRGNGLQFIKVGAESIRISKAIEKGAEIRYAYGWVDLLSPGGVPLQVVVGTARDPLQLCCLRVSDLQASTAFCTEQLGMQVLPPERFPLARTAGSNFEPTQPRGSVLLGYGPGYTPGPGLDPDVDYPIDYPGLCLLLVDGPVNSNSAAGGGSTVTSATGEGSTENGRNRRRARAAGGAVAPLRVGSLLDALTIVVDDSAPDVVASYPAVIRDFLLSRSSGRSNATPEAGAGGRGGETLRLRSPDGYGFVVKPYSVFRREATKSAPPPDLGS